MSQRKVVARGAVMIDPRAAVARLREFQLLDPRMYVLELVRAAVASGAEHIAVENTSRELILDVRCAPPSEAELSRVLDFLLSNADRRLRLLAIAVNTALGMRPDHVDLYTSLHDAAVGVSRVRWKPAPRGARSDDASMFEPASVERVSAPHGMPTPGLRVHVREAFGWSVLREWASTPAESGLLRSRCGAVRVPLTLGGAPIDAAAPPPALATVTASEGSADDALEIELRLLRADARDGGNTVVFYELGVELARDRLCPERAGAPAALWMSVRAGVLATNNARSRVNLDGALGRALGRLWGRALGELVAQVARESDPSDAQREALATLLLVPVEGADGRLGSVPPEVRAALGEAPIFVSPAGVSLPVASIGRAEGPVGTLRADAPLAPEVARFLPPLVWVRKTDRARALLAESLGLRDRRDAVDAAIAVRARYVRFQSQPQQAPRVEGDPAHDLLRASFAAGDVRGELTARRAPTGSAGTLRVRAYLDGRPFDFEAIEAAALDIDVALSAPSLSPRPAFEGIARDGAFERAVEAARRAFVEAAAERCAREPERTTTASLVRQSLVWIVRADSASDARALAALALTRWPALFHVKVWGTTTGAMVSTEAVAELARSPLRVVPFATEGVRGERPDGRFVLSASKPERELLATFLPPNARWVDAGPWLTRAAVPMRARVRTELASRAAAWMPFTLGAVRGEAAALMGRGELLLLHNGHLADTRSLVGRLGSVLVVLEDPALWPAPSGRSVLDESLSDDARRCIEAMEGELVITLCRALQGERAARQRVALDGAEVPPAVTRLLLGALAALRSALGASFGLREPITGAALAELIENVPLVPVCTAPNTLTLTSVRALRGRSAPLPVLRGLPAEVDIEGFDPLVIVDREVERLVASALGAALEDATPTLAARRQSRARRLARERFLQRPALDPTTLPEAVTFRHEVAAARGARGVAGVPSPGVTPRIEVLLEGRLIVTLARQEVEFPVLARVELGDEARFTPTMGALSAVGRTVLDELIATAVGALVADIAATALKGDDCGAEGRALLVRWIGHASRKKGQQSSLREIFGGLKVWRVGGGARVSAREAISEGRVLYAREPPEPWEPRREGEPPEPAAVWVPADEPMDVWAKCLQVLSGAQGRDMTDRVERTQRARRLQLRRGGDVKLAGKATAPALATRIERHDSSLGVGELRLVAGDAAVALTVFVDGRRARELTLPSQFAAACALESPWIEPDDIDGSVERAGLVGRLVAIARTLMNELFTADDDAVGELPAWVGPALRWHVLTATPDDLPEEARAAPLFRDSEARAMSLGDVLSEAAAHAAVAFTVSPPERPIAPLGTDRRVMVLTPAEVRWLRAGVSVLDYSETLREDAVARAYDESPPVARVEVRHTPSGVLGRVPLVGVEGEAVIFAPGASHAPRVFWHRGHRALGDGALGAPWPVWAAAECPSLVPNRKRTQPEPGAALDEALDRVQRAVLVALESQYAAPAEAVVSVLLREARELGLSRPSPVAVGRLWLTSEIGEGRVLVRTSDGTRLCVCEAPVQGAVWWRAEVEGRAEPWRPTVESAVRWAWHRMLESLTERADEAGEAGELARLHIAHALSQDAMRNGRLGTWARRTKIPNSETSWAWLCDAEAERQPVVVVPSGDARAQAPRVLEARPGRWFALLVERGLLIDEATQARREREARAKEAEAREARAKEAEAREAAQEAARRAKGADGRARAAEAEAAWRTGADALAHLRACGVGEGVVREVVATETDDAPWVERGTAVVRVGRRSVVVAGIEAQPRRRAGVMLATLVLGALGRAHGERIDEAEVMARLIERI